MKTSTIEGGATEGKATGKSLNLQRQSIRSAVETIGMIVAPTTLLSALLFYFGWVYAGTRSLYFGIDPSTLGFSTQDYLLRSIDAVYHPLGSLLLLTLLFLWIHSTVSRWIRQGRHLRAVRLIHYVLATGGMVLLASAIAGVVRRPLFGIESLVTPLTLALGLIATTYAVFIRSALRQTNEFSEANTGALRSMYLLILVLLLVLSLFWAAGDWAQGLALGRARRLAENLSSRPGVIVYSASQLHINGPGVEVSQIGDQDSAYRFKYEGLKLLIRSDRKYFLVPSGWSRADGVVIVLPEKDNIRMEFKVP